LGKLPYRSKNIRTSKIIMASQLSQVLTHIIEVYSTSPLVNTITFKDDDVIDVSKENIYPLVSFQLLSSPAPLQDLREFVFEFTILNQRDDAKIATPSKLLSDINYIDNIGIADSIANNFILEVIKSHNDLDINIVEASVSEFVPVRRDERNNLDGVKFNCTFSIHQNDI